MAVYWPIKEERRASEPGTTKATYTCGRTSCSYINSTARLNPALAYNQIYVEYKDDLRIHQKKEQAVSNVSNYII